MAFNPLIMIVGLLVFLVVMIGAVYFVVIGMANQKPIHDFSDYDTSDMEDISFKIPNFVKFSFTLLVLFCYAPLFFLIGMILTTYVINSQSTPIVPFWQLITDPAFDIFSFFCIFLFFIGLYYSKKLIRIFKSEIIIKENILTVLEPKQRQEIALDRFNELLDYEVYFNQTGHHVKNFTCSLVDGENLKINTIYYESRDILRLLAFLNKRAVNFNDKLSMEKFFNIKQK